MDANEFMAKVKPAGQRRSPLHQHADAIQKLRTAGYTYDQILLYLNGQGVYVSKTRLCNFATQELETRGRQAPAPSAPASQAPPPTSGAKPPPHPKPAPGEPTPEQIQEFTRLAQLGLKKRK